MKHKFLATPRRARNHPWDFRVGDSGLALSIFRKCAQISSVPGWWMPPLLFPLIRREHETKHKNKKKIWRGKYTLGLDCFCLIGLLSIEPEFALTALKNRHISRLFLSRASRLHSPVLSAEGTWCIVGEPAGWEPFPERFPPTGPRASRPADLELIFASLSQPPLPPFPGLQEALG